MKQYRPLYRRYRKEAKQSKREFLISFEEFGSLVVADCFYCGASPTQKRINRGRNKKEVVYYSNGIDRKDNSKGYIKDNCLPCCEICNKAKRGMPYEEFLSWLDRVARFQKPIAIEIL